MHIAGTDGKVLAQAHGGDTTIVVAAGEVVMCTAASILSVKSLGMRLDCVGLCPRILMTPCGAYLINGKTMIGSWISKM